MDHRRSPSKAVRKEVTPSSKIVSSNQSHQPPSLASQPDHSYHTMSTSEAKKRQMPPDGSNNVWQEKAADNSTEDVYAKRRKLNTAMAPDVSLPLRQLIPPKDCPEMRERLQDMQKIGPSPTSHGVVNGSMQFDWSVVIARAKSHPHEAAESYFGPTDSSQDQTKPAAQEQAKPDAVGDKSNILTYKPLHAMLKYDPSLEAVEAVLRAHPEAALDVTFEGTALKIACESRVSSMLVLRLLLVAEMAMRKKAQQEQDQKHSAESDTSASALGEAINSELEPSSIQGDSRISAQNMFFGHNPIIWITERRIPVKTAAMLLKWYPIGAFQRPWDEDGAPATTDAFDTDGIDVESPLIDIVDAFARDHFDEVAAGGEGAGADGDDGDGYDSEIDYDSSPPLQQNTSPQAAAMQPQTHQQRDHVRKERQWEKFLHILYATDLSLQSTRRRISVAEESALPNATTTAAAAAASLLRSSESEVSPQTTGSRPLTPFRPVHAWIRCLTSPFLGLERIRPYGVWSILRVMSKRIPSEFTMRDASDGNRTAFQTLAESSATDCKLCLEEVKDVVECLMDADYRSAFLPRQRDGRLIGHVALENGWPCKDLFSKKKSATCA